MKLRRDSGKYEITIPLRLLRAAGWRPYESVAFALTEDGLGLVIRPFTRL